MIDRNASAPRARAEEPEPAGSAAGRIAHLHRLCDDLLRDDPMRARELAAEAMRLADDLGDGRLIARCHIRLGESHHRLDNYPIATKHFNKALKLASDLGGNMVIESSAYTGIGMVKLARGDYAGALASYMRALELARLAGIPRRVAEVQVRAGEAHRLLGDLSAAAEAQFEALQAFIGLKDRRGEAQVSNHIAVIYASLEEWDNALEYFNRSLTINRSIGDRMGEATVAMNIGGVYNALGRPADGRVHAEGALKIFRAIGARSSIPNALLFLGSSHVFMGEFDRGMSCYDEALRIHDKAGTRGSRARTLLCIAEVHELQGDWELADHVVDEALAIARELGYLRIEYFAARFKAEINEALGDLPRALEYHKLHSSIRERLESQELRRTLRAGELRAGREKDADERERYRTKIVELEEEMERSRQELVATALRLARREGLISQIKEQAAASVRANNAGGLARELLRRIRMDRGEADRWLGFEQRFSQVYRGFTAALLERHRLTPAELRVCVLLRLGLASKDICEILGIALHTAETHRRRIRRKLGLTKDENLVTCLASFSSKGRIQGDE